MAKQTAAELVDKLLEGLYKDLKESYRIALQVADVDKQTIAQVEQDVEGYVTNHWF